MNDSFSSENLILIIIEYHTSSKKSIVDLPKSHFEADSEIENLFELSGKVKEKSLTLKV